MSQEDKEQDSSVPLEELLKKCMDAEGYVVFIASLTNKTDEQKNRIIDFDYRRYHLSLEDTKLAVIKFREAVVAEMEKGLDFGEI